MKELHSLCWPHNVYLYMFLQVLRANGQAGLLRIGIDARIVYQVINFFSTENFTCFFDKRLDAGQLPGVTYKNVSR